MVLKFVAYLLIVVAQAVGVYSFFQAFRCLLNGSEFCPARRLLKYVGLAMAATCANFVAVVLMSTSLNRDIPFSTVVSIAHRLALEKGYAPPSPVELARYCEREFGSGLTALEACPVAVIKPACELIYEPPNQYEFAAACFNETHERACFDRRQYGRFLAYWSAMVKQECVNYLTGAVSRAIVSDWKGSSKAVKILKSYLPSSNKGV